MQNKMPFLWLRWVNISCQYMQFRQSACMFRISQGFPWCQDGRYIAVTCTLPLKSGYDDIATFLRPLKVHRCWRYMQFYKFLPNTDIHLVSTLSRLYPKLQYVDFHKTTKELLLQRLKCLMGLF
jgi:hypothetical protein